MPTTDEAAEVRPVTINITDHAAEVKAGYVWTDDRGDTHGSLDFGATYLVCHTVNQARDIAIAASELADRMETHTARRAAQQEVPGAV